ncbi:MAG: class I SAM-dependent methyltransferase [Actinomycetota bacterium]|nr:class I SAM-dependent methyltransferase [Actinomycetota bacterium]
MDQEFMRSTLVVEDNHWWYRGRRQVIRAELDRLPISPGARILDAGCGSGRTLVELVDYGQVAGVELSPEAAEVARGRGLGEIVQGPLEHLPWRPDSFELIVCLDVIEHTPDDRVALQELWRVCRPGGFLLVTVPAYQSLWSQHDESNHHYRRYSRRSLGAAATQAGWSLGRMSGFNSLLLAPAAAVRLAQRRMRSDNGAVNDLYATPWWFNDALELPLRLEASWLRHGRTLPMGLSLLAILRKPWAPS